MMFVDGENFTLRGEAVLNGAGYSPTTGDFYQPKTFLWAPVTTALGRPEFVRRCIYRLENIGRRAFYYTVAEGDRDQLDEQRDVIKCLHFMPRVFHKQKGRSSKRVDITMATEMLSNAHQGNFDAAILIAGDEDYVPLVEEIQHMGKIVIVGFFANQGLSQHLRRQADCFAPLDDYLINRWQMCLRGDPPTGPE